MPVLGDAVSRVDGDERGSGLGRLAQPPVEEAVFTAVFREHSTMCWRLARRIVRDEGLAHEVVQEVFLSWWRSVGGGYRADRGSIAAYLSTLTHHKAVDAVRTSERHRRLLAAAGSQLSWQPEQRLVEEAVWWELGRQSLVVAMSTLTPAQREVLRLAYGAGLTQVQIAGRLGIPLGTVKSRTHSGMLRLRAAIGGTWTPSGPTGPTGLTCPTGPAARSQREPACRPRAAEPERGGIGRRASAGTVGDDVELCAAALVQIASLEREDSSGGAALVSEAAALVGRHGDAGMYGLVVALARLAAQAPTGRGEGRRHDDGEAIALR